MELTRRWTCDSCFMPIESVEDGWVEWQHHVRRNHYREGTLRLVHHELGCQYDNRAVYADTGYIIQNLPLEYYVEADGLMMLLRHLEEGFPQTDVVEMIKRLHIPGYERARHYFEEAIAAGAFEPNTQLGYHHQYQIEATLRYVDERDKR